MKTFFGMTAAVLLVVSLLFVSLPGTARAAGKVSLTEMVSIKKAADEAAQSAKAQLEKARTAEEKLLAKWLVKQAEINAEVAGELLEEVKAGEDVSRQDVAAFCAAIAKAVHEAAGALAAGDMAKAEDALDRIARMSSNLPTAENARAEMQGADGAVRNQSVTAEDVKKMPKAANARAEYNGGCMISRPPNGYVAAPAGTPCKMTGGKPGQCGSDGICGHFTYNFGCMITNPNGHGYVAAKKGTPCKIGKCKGICDNGICVKKNKMAAAMAGAQKTCGCTSCNECQQCNGESCVPIENPSPHNPKCLKK